MQIIEITLQRDGALYLRKTPWSCKTGKTLGGGVGKIYISKGQRNKLQWQVFSSKCSIKMEVKRLESEKKKSNYS